jgi:hypothetical protein
MDTKDYFNLVNTSNYIQNINQGKTGLMKGIYNNFHADQTKAQSNYMDRRKV